ncbi:MAG TPA: aldo/keto reductase [Patescibacteria group bacterium]
MKIPTKKLNNGFEMPIYGLGTWQMGGGRTKDTTNDEADISAIKNAIELGVTHIDTAEKYAEGHAEELVGKAIQGYDRKNIFLVTKVAEDHLRYNDVFASLNKSLERLQTDYLDLYMIHGPSPTIPIEETMKAMDEIRGKGLAKNIAVSNFSLERFQKAKAASNSPIVAGQYHLNLKYREAERKGIVEYFQKNDVMFIAWRPLQKGMLLQQKQDILTEMAQKYHKTPSQIALNWLISQKNIVTLSKTRSLDHLKENLGALDFTMGSIDIERLRNEYPGQEDISDAVPLL